MSIVKPSSYITPEGIAQNPRLIVPDTKFVSEGVYAVKMEFTGEDAKNLAKFLDTKYQESIAEAKKNNPGKKIKEADSPYSWNDLGVLSVSFKMKASGTTKDGRAWSRKPTLLNADLTPFTSVEIASGSKMVISYTPSSFYSPMLGAGVSMRLEAVQVLELPEPTSEVGNYGFTKREPKAIYPSPFKKIRSYWGSLLRSSHG